MYVDSSAFLKLYVDEPESDACEEFMIADPEWISARHTHVEVRRNLTRLLSGRPLASSRDQFDVDWHRTDVVELDRPTCDFAAELAEVTGARTLDALHLGAARRAGGGALPVLTYDLRQAQVARSLGWSVLGA
jgi:hypothetical protein